MIVAMPYASLVFGISWTFVCTKVNIIKCKCNIRISIFILNFKQVSASALITSDNKLKGKLSI